MESVGFYTVLLSLAGLLLIYLILARTFRGWVIPFLALVPLVVGILWTMGLIRALFGSVNLLTSMMALVLLGLGIDFAIHVIARFQEERLRGGALEDVLSKTLGSTGVAVGIGAMTTSIAFFTLLVGRTVGFDEFGTSAGFGVLLTLCAVLLSLPPLLVIRERFLLWRGHREAGFRDRDGSIRFPVATRIGERASQADASNLASPGYAWIGSVAVSGWRRPFLFLGVSAVLLAGSWYGMLHTDWEWDFLELEAKGLRSVELQREIPKRYGTSDHAAWVVASSLEETRKLKEDFRDLPAVGDVSALSDWVPPSERIVAYRSRLEEFRARALRARTRPWQVGDEVALRDEIDRLWDNLDLMSNLAFTAGLDRIVAVIDRLTGFDSESGETSDQAVLPVLSDQLAVFSDAENRVEGSEELRRLAEEWALRLRENVLGMVNPDPVTIADVPLNYRNLFLPRVGDGILLHILPRQYLFDRDALERFAAQTEEVHPDVVSTEKLILVMNTETLRDGERAVLFALGAIALLLLVHFRGPSGLISLIPLAAGTLAMLGLMFLLGIKYNYMNMIAVPIILGIGIDDGVHALHRYLEDQDAGEDGVRLSFSHVGKAIFLTSVTTMVGFGSVGCFEMRGMASFGWVLVLGVGTCFLATLLVLPPAIRLFQRPSSGSGEEVGEGGVIRGSRARIPIWVIGVGLAWSFLHSVGPTPVAGQEDGAAWLARIEAAETVPHSYGVIRQTITTSGGSERSFRIRNWSASGGDVALMAYVEPRRVAGDRILQLEGGEQFWYYMSRRDVTRHFAGHTRRQQAMGSDFSFEDLAMGDLTEDYTAVYLGMEELEGNQTVKLRLTPTPTGPSYDHLILWAGFDDHLTRKIEYYDEDHHLKTLFLSGFEVMEGRRVPMRMEMQNHRENSKTVMETLEITFSQEPDPSLFTQAALTRPLPGAGK
jgi:hypothetical protein